MQKETLVQDLEVASAIARSGRDAPLLSGPYGLMWGSLLTAGLSLHYLIMTQVVALPAYSLMAIWIAFGLIGGFGSAVLNRRISGMQGANSFGNKVDAAVWTLFGSTMLSLFLVLAVATVTGLLSFASWGLIVVFGFFGQGIAYGTTTRIQPSGPSTYAAVASFTVGAIALLFHDQPTVYLIGAIGSVVAIVLPALLSRKG